MFLKIIQGIILPNEMNNHQARDINVYREKLEQLNLFACPVEGQREISISLLPWINGTNQFV